MSQAVFRHKLKTYLFDNTQLVQRIWGTISQLRSDLRTCADINIKSRLMNM